MGETLGLAEAVSMALGGMIGGGIYAVLGVVAGIAGPAIWLGFVLAGAVAMAAAYSYAALNGLADTNGGSVTFVQTFVGNSTLAGMIGWTLLVGYVGSMAMYAFAFGEFALRLGVVPETAVALPLRPVLSVGAVGLFLALNLLGAHAAGVVENALVAGKLLVLVAFGVAGLAYAGLVSPEPTSLGGSRLLSSGPAVAAAVSFVAFQGWQLLFYDQESIEDPVDTIRRAVLVSIPVAVAVYVLVAVATVNIAPDALAESPHTALATAAETAFEPVGLAGLGGLAISLSALVSTGSAINATLFSTGYFAKGMLTDDLLPDRVGDPDVDGVPSRTLVLIATVAAGLAVVGSLGAITSFASLAFVVVFGAMCAIALAHRDADPIHPLPPVVGVLGTLAFLGLMTYHLYTAERGTFYVVLALAVVVIVVELAYFEREAIERDVVPFDLQG